MNRYARITLTDGTRFFLRVDGEDTRAVRGIEVDREGDEVVPRGPGGFHNRLRIIERGTIARLTWYRMSPRYATLERAGKA